MVVKTPVSCENVRVRPGGSSSFHYVRWSLLSAQQYGRGDENRTLQVILYAPESSAVGTRTCGTWGVEEPRDDRKPRREPDDGPWQGVDLPKREREGVERCGRGASEPGDSQDQLLEVPLYNHVLDGCHSDLQQVGVGCVRKVSVNFLLGVPVQRLKFVHEVLACLLVVVGRATVVGEAVGRDRAGD